jgi:hypothetical protein
MRQAITMNDLDECELLYSQLLNADDSPKFNPGAKVAADLDNLHSAFQHLDGSHPVAINTDEARIECVKKILQNLILVQKWQLILTIFIQLSNIWMVLIQLLSTLMKPASNT